MGIDGDTNGQVREMCSRRAGLDIGSGCRFIMIDLVKTSDGRLEGALDAPGLRRT